MESAQADIDYNLNFFYYLPQVGIVVKLMFWNRRQEVGQGTHCFIPPKVFVETKTTALAIGTTGMTIGLSRWVIARKAAGVGAYQLSMC